MLNRYAWERGPGRKPALLLPSDRQRGGTPQIKKVITNAQGNAFYGTASYRQESLTTPKSSEGDSRHSAFLYRNAAPYAIRYNCISLSINRFTPPHTQVYTLPSKRAGAQANAAEGIPLSPIYGNKGNNGLPSVAYLLPCEDGSTRYPLPYGFSYPEKGLGQFPKRGQRVCYTLQAHPFAAHYFDGNNLYVNNRKTFIHSINA